MESSLDDDHVDVLVVGAGPAGLMLACNLVRFGIKTVIIDDRPDKTATGRADGLQPKTIETFRQLGLADELLKKGVRIYDICFWTATNETPLHRVGRDIHYPSETVDVLDPFILLVHQGMVEDVFITDLKSRGVEVIRSTSFIDYSISKDANGNECIEATFEDGKSYPRRTFRSDYLVGCDGAHSKVKKVLLGDTRDADDIPSGKSTWGVLDGVIETDFPDLWSKAVISNEAEGSVLCIPRERNMTRLYIELHPEKAQLSSEKATEDFVMSRAKAILKPFKLEWTSREWFGIYSVGQRVAKNFSDEHNRVLIAGDAAHTHSPKAAQGMNVSMHDTFNLAWKLNLVIRDLASPSLLQTYEQERRKIAQDLIDFDYEHAKAFAAGDPKALADNFTKNIRFISGVGAEYAPNILNLPEESIPTREGRGVKGQTKPGCLLPPARVTRYIDANPVDLQLEIPMLSQFRIIFFTPDSHTTSSFLTSICTSITSPSSILQHSALKAAKSCTSRPRPQTETDEYTLPSRYTPISQLCTYAIVTSMPKADVEIRDLPELLREGRWTFYLDDIMHGPSCTEKLVGQLDDEDVAMAIVRPDGYVGRVGRWNTKTEGAAAQAEKWLEGYFEGFLRP